MRAGAWAGVRRQWLRSARRAFSAGGSGPAGESAPGLLPANARLAEGILARDRRALSKAVTLVESQLPAHNEQARLLIDHVLEMRRSRDRGPGERGSSPDDAPSGGDSGAAGSGIRPLDADLPPTHLPSFRLGIAGPPGAGKSTFIEALGMGLTSAGHRVAVIAIDPSSSRTGGSILGDKTRMTLLSRDPNAFVRPSATWGTLGGLAQHTNDVVLLCESSGYDIVLVETVGLGQSEVAVDDAVDMCMLLLPPAAGDDLQGVKKGIMEIADLVVINKADGELATPARHAAASVRQALQLSRPKTPLWKARVAMSSALTDPEGVMGVWDIVREYRNVMESADANVAAAAPAVGKYGGYQDPQPGDPDWCPSMAEDHSLARESGTSQVDQLQTNGGVFFESALARRRASQNRQWMIRQFQDTVLRALENDDSLREVEAELEEQLLAGHITPRAAAARLFKHFKR